MDVESIFQEVQNELSPKRWRHTQGVMNKAIELAQRHDGNVEQAYLAALLHDVAREWSPEQWVVEAKMAGLVMDEAALHSPVLLHAPLAAWVAKNRFGVIDELVLCAIARHTIGGTGLSLLDKILYLADALEEGRSYKGVEELRNLAIQDIDVAMLSVYDQTLRYMIKREEAIHPETIAGRNELLWRRNQ